MATPIEIKTTVKEKYGAAATRAASGGLAIGCCGSRSGCGPYPITSNLYELSEQASLPAEAIAATAGLGYRIFLVRRYLDMAVILPYVLWITLLAFAMDYLLRQLARRAFPWYYGRGGEGAAT